MEKKKKENRNADKLVAVQSANNLPIYSGILYENFNYCATYEI